MFLDVGLGTSPQLVDFGIVDIIKMTPSQVLDSLQKKLVLAID